MSERVERRAQVHNRLMKGVNLGGWLVLEKWITPSVFKGVMAQDEHGLCQELGKKKRERLESHRSTFIIKEDFAWLKSKGFDAVRLPVPHWAFEDTEPYVACIGYVDMAFAWAAEYGISILLDLHTAPGSQNGDAHSGRQGPIGWHMDPANIEATVEVISQLAEKYGQHESLMAIELLNEPSRKIPKKHLTDYYQRAIHAVRQHTEAPVVISDAFDPEAWEDEFTDAWLDMHMYQVFSPDDNKRPIHKVIKKARYDWSEQISRIQRKRPVIVGEWGLAFGKSASRGLDEYERGKAKQAYAGAQLLAFETARGWFYWTYKTEDQGSWSLRDTIHRGWIQLPTEPPISPREYDAHA